jgi:hypothetical protein
LFPSIPSGPYHSHSPWALYNWRWPKLDNCNWSCTEGSRIGAIQIQSRRLSYRGNRFEVDLSFQTLRLNSLKAGPWVMSLSKTKETFHSPCDWTSTKSADSWFSTQFEQSVTVIITVRDNKRNFIHDIKRREIVKAANCDAE